MHLGGVSTVTVEATAAARQAVSGVEMALVLDITGSMNESDPSGGTKLEALKKASNLLINELYGDDETRDGISVAVVPYNSVVNVGDHRTDWLDEEPDDDDDDEQGGSSQSSFVSTFTGGSGSGSFSFSSSASTSTGGSSSSSTSTGGSGSSSTSFDFGYGDSDFGLSEDDISDEDWRGCVEARSDTMDRDDTSPSEEPFPAMAWPAVNSYFNPDNSPNHLCPTSEILPLTDEKSEILDRIDELTADGATLTTVGFVWGWRAISPRWRDDWDLSDGQPVDYDDARIKKAIVFMTDGITIIHPGNDYYNAYGFTEDGRLGTTNATAATNESDGRLRESCQLAKDQGIEVYTVMYALEDSAIEQLYRECATSDDHFFDAPDGPRLQAAFRNIAGQLTALHLSQ